MPDEAQRHRPWLRAGGEFLVILASILAAFALDAWWDSRNSDQRVLEKLTALDLELVTIRELIDAERAKLETARQAVAAMLRHVSPQAPLVEPDELNTLMDLSFRFRSVILGRAARPVD